MNPLRRVFTGLALSVAVVAAALSVPTAASAGLCNTTYPLPAGTFDCSYPRTLVVWPDGHQQYFLLWWPGDAIYDSYQAVAGDNSTWTAWRYLGGIGRSAVTINTGWQNTASAEPLLFYNNYSDWIALRVTGTDGLSYCKAWTATSNWQPSQATWVNC